MPEFPGRDEWERELALRFGNVSAGYLDELLALVEDGAQTVPEEMLARYADDLGAAMSPALVDVYLTSAAWIAGEYGVEVDWSLVNQSAIEWARSYGGELVRGLTETTRTLISQGLEAFLGGGVDLQSLRDLFAPAFGPVRADLIASTEVTRAAIEGQKEWQRQLEGSGLVVRRVWLTANDELVCPICAPLNGVAEDVQGGGFSPAGIGLGIPEPPAHPRCRCNLNYEVVDATAGGR